jgi:hypothetical protein
VARLQGAARQEQSEGDIPQPGRRCHRVAEVRGAYAPLRRSNTSKRHMHLSRRLDFTNSSMFVRKRCLILSVDSLRREWVHWEEAAMAKKQDRWMR